MTPELHHPPLDYDFYKQEIAPILPERVLDFHTHVWSSANWKFLPWESDAPGGKYMVVDPLYSPEKLLADGKAAFPDRPYEAVCFGYPVPVTDWDKDTAYVRQAGETYPNLWPLILAGPALDVSRERYEQALDSGRFSGFKVFLNWFGDNYGNLRVEDMFGPAELALANERRLVLMLHVPRTGRLADPEIQQGVRWLADECPNAIIVLAHCGRCYMPAEMKQAIGCLRGLENVWMDASMVMDPVVFQMVLDGIGPQRLLFATDYPVAAMRGRRVRVLDHWVDVVLDGYPESAWRVGSAGIHAGFMTWEIALAIRWAADLTGLGIKDLHDIFYHNGAALLQQANRR